MFEEMRLRSFTMYLIIFFIFFGISDAMINPASDITVDIIAMFIILILFPLFWFSYQMKKHDISLRQIISWSEVIHKMPSLLLITLTLLLFSISFLWIQTYLLSIVTPDFAEKQLLTAVEMVTELENATTLQKVFLILSACLVAPIAEEFIFRGLLLKRIAKKTNIIISLIVTNLLFAILHMDYVGSFMFGILLSLIYIKTNNLLFPIMIHFLNNTLLSLFDLFKVPIPDFINYTEIEQVASFMIPNLIIGFVSLPPLIYYLYKYRLKATKLDTT